MTANAAPGRLSLSTRGGRDLRLLLRDEDGH
jgi:hypothetical protein